MGERLTEAMLREAFDKTGGSNVVVATRSGKQYHVHEDQLCGLKYNDLIYGYPIKPHRRYRGRAVWFRLRNLTLVKDTSND